MESECAATLASEVLAAHGSETAGFLSLEEYLVWTVDRSLPEDFLHLLFQVCNPCIKYKNCTVRHIDCVDLITFHLCLMKTNFMLKLW